MNLYLMRHGIALAQDDPSVANDAERPLTGKGVKRMRKAAKGVRRLNIPFDAILTSPALRARQTAEIIATALNIEARLEEISGLAPESTVEHLMFGLTRYQDRAHVLLVGHEPLLSNTAAALLGGRKPANVTVDFKKGSLCCIEIETLPAASPGTLRWLLTPKQLRSLG
ncbi:MAG TPA: phosphohistidine phosphatase SixA [Candidatus Binatia bacterium]|jgi:phosphohistidine phosphatase